MKKILARVEAFCVAKPRIAAIALLVTSAGWGIAGPIAMFCLLL